MSERAMMKCGCVAQGVLTARNGVPLDPPIPSCLIHDCTEVADAKPDLTGRMAKCAYRHSQPSPRQRPGPSPVPSSFDLAFFEYCGPGSREATELCVCGYAQVAHEKNGGKCPQIAVKRGLLGKFQAKGPQEFDRFYCGCFGWD